MGCRLLITIACFNLSTCYFYYNMYFLLFLYRLNMSFEAIAASFVTVLLFVGIDEHRKRKKKREADKWRLFTRSVSCAVTLWVSRQLAAQKWSATWSSPLGRGSKMLHIGQMIGVGLLMALLLHKSATPMQPNRIPNDRYQKTLKIGWNFTLRLTLNPILLQPNSPHAKR